MHSEPQQLLETFAKLNDYKDTFSHILFTRIRQYYTDQEIINYMIKIGKWELVPKPIQ